MSLHHSTVSGTHKDASLEQRKALPGVHHALNRIYWQTPAVMLGSTVIGLALAVAHDRFYEHYNGRAVHSALEQKVIINVGTAFAFLVKMFFCIAAATVFSQQLFRSLKHRAESIENIDALFDILGNILHFSKGTLWLRHYALAIMALVIWCIPIAAVFTPGTIHVQPALKYDNAALLRPVEPQQSWIGTQNFAQTELDYTAIWKVGEHTFADAVLNGPSGALYSVALGSISQRNILAIPPPNENSSYELSFFAPSLQCSGLPDQDLVDFERSISAAEKAGYLPGQDTTLEGVETVNNSTVLIVKYNAWISSTQGQNLTNPSWNNGTYDQTQPDEANDQYFYFSSGTDSILLACHLHNATYSANFTFVNSVQTIVIKSVIVHELIPLNATVDVDKPDYANLVYNAIYNAFNNIVIAITINNTGTPSLNLLTYGPGPVLVSALWDYIEGSNPLSTDLVVSTLQTIFQNITLSTLSSPSLRLSPSQFSPVRSTTWRTVNTYIYNPHDLYIAYGLALLCTALCVAWGIFLMHTTKASYSLAFSTIMRTTRHEEIDTILKVTARRGEEPLPREMRTVKLVYGDEGLAVVDGREDSEKGGRHEGSTDGFAVTMHDWSNVGRGVDVRHEQRVKRKPVPRAQTRLYQPVDG